MRRACRKYSSRVALGGSPYQDFLSLVSGTPSFLTRVLTSFPTFTQSVSLPPKTVIHDFFASTSIACLRDSEVQSVSSVLPALVSTTSGRTPDRVAMMSRGESGVCRSSRSLIWVSRKSRSSTVTSVNGSPTRVSVVPMHDRVPIGMT